MYSSLQSCLFLPCAAACNEANGHLCILCLHGELGLETDLAATERMLAWQSITSARSTSDLVHSGVAPQMHAGATQRLVCTRGADSREEGQDDCSHQHRSQSKTSGTAAGAASD